MLTEAPGAATLKKRAGERRGWRPLSSVRVGRRAAQCFDARESKGVSFGFVTVRRPGHS
jgi:hypothetical protein